MRRNLFAGAAALHLATMRISAHHAFAAEYDENGPVTVSGTVTRFEGSPAWIRTFRGIEGKLRIRLNPPMPAYVAVTPARRTRLSSSQAPGADGLISILQALSSAFVLIP
jgi:hypothetical protein